MSLNQISGQPMQVTLQGGQIISQQIGGGHNLQLQQRQIQQQPNLNALNMIVTSVPNVSL